MRVHVTGASGFLGRHVLPRLVERGHTVTALARSSTAAVRVRGLGAQPIVGDLDDPASVDAAFGVSGAESLVSLASLGFGHGPTIVAAAEESGLERAVFLSTTAVFTTLNAASKTTRLAAEQAVHDSALAWTIVRPTMIYGTPADRNMARLLQLLRRSPVVPLPGDGRRLQQPVHVDDVAGAVVVALESPLAAGHDYALAGPEPLSLREVIGEAATALGRSVRLVPVPLPLAVIALGLYERIATRPRITAEQLRRLGEDKAFDITDARRDLRFHPRSFAAGIAEEAAML